MFCTSANTLARHHQTLRNAIFKSEQPGE